MIYFCIMNKSFKQQQNISIRFIFKWKTLLGNKTITVPSNRSEAD